MRRSTRIFPALVAALSAPHALAQAPVELVVDLHQAPAYGLGSQPIFVASDGARTWFWALGPDDLTDLWISDGTTAGTQLALANVASANTMVQEYYLGGVALPSGRAVFIAPSEGFPASGVFGQPTGSDGTPTGSAVLDSALPQTLRATGDCEEFDGEAWFCARAVEPGVPTAFQLWRTDGTAGGTRHAFDAGANPPPAVRGNVVAGGGHVWFTSLTGGAGSGAPSTVWRTDGSGGPPSLAFTTGPDERVELCAWLPASGRVLAVVETVQGVPALDPEWWLLGPAGGEQLADAAIAGARWCVVNGSIAYFVGRVGANPTQLLVTDGTVPGTAVVPDQAQGLVDAVGPSPGTAFGQGLVCLAWHPSLGYEPTYVDRNGMTLLVDAEPGAASAHVSAFVEHAGELYFHGRQGTSFPGALFRTDGTPAGTFSNPGASFVGSAPLWPTGRTQAGPLYAFDEGGGIGSEPWRAEPTTVALVADLTVNATESAEVEPLATLGPRLIFAANDGTAGIEPWITDGTAAGTHLLADLWPGPASSFPGAGVAVGGVAVLTAILPGVGGELVLSDGSAAGSAAVDLAPGPPSSQVANLVAAGGAAWFSADGAGPSGVVEPGLWRSDGTAAGTAQVAAVAVDDEFGQALIYDAEGVGGAAVFFVGVDAGGAELWRSDGTAAGTVRVIDLRPGSGSSFPRAGVAVDGRFFFTADNGLFGREVWVTDGTAVGTTPVTDLAPLGADGVASVGAVAFDQAYVVATPEGSVPSGPVAIDASSLTLRYLVDPALSAADPTLAGPATGGFLVTDGGLLFATEDPAAPKGHARLWRAASVASGAVPVPTPIAAGVPLRAVDAGAGRAVFAGGDGAGTEPWLLACDGATAPLADLFPGPGSSDPGPPARLGAELVFAARAPAYGLELFRTTVATVGGNVVAPLAGGCAQTGSAATLAGVGHPTLAADFDVRLDGGVPLAPVVWAVDVTHVPAPVVGPCATLLPQPLALALGATDVAGTALLDLAVPADPALLDQVLVFQALVVAVPGPFLGISSLSDGLEIVVGP